MVRPAGRTYLAVKVLYVPDKAKRWPETRRRTNAVWEQESGLPDAVCECGNLKPAYRRVVENKGAAELFMHESFDFFKHHHQLVVPRT